MIPSVTPFFQPPDLASFVLASVSVSLHFSHIIFFLPVFPYIFISLAIISLGFAVYLFYLLIRYYITISVVLLEIKPPHDTRQSAFSTEQLFTTLHSLGLQSSWWQCFLGRKKLYTLELFATRDNRIRFCIRVHKDEADVVKKTLRAYLAGVTIREIEEYLPDFSDIFGIWNIVTFRLFNHYALPLQKHTVLSEHDPMGGLISLREKLSCR